MKYFHLLFIFTSINFGLLHAQVDKSHYFPATLDSLSKVFRGYSDTSKVDTTKGEVRFFANIASRFKIRARFNGAFRLIDDDRKRLLSMWWKHAKRPDLDTLMKTEILVQEGSKEYWIPIQQQVFEYLREDFLISHDFVFYIVFIGIIRSIGAKDLPLTYMITEYEIQN